ncbi:GNAT family N-acetyltransferase [Methylohalobius crimeensis]|uniref:GNAT family N-acetyltransferase n=1 Tax=Methylohalobius crimeensis TaxID=244365 RepID=UPI0003B53EDA|nr:GNAT family N-acetyltransferase [Methylohalobius crimeensis]
MNQEIMPRLRPVHEPDDLPLLAEIYCQSRDYEMAKIPHWTEEDKRRFLLQQFEVQHKYYRAYLDGTRFQVVEDRNGEPLGRLYLRPLEDQIRVVDIALLAHRRGKGVGSRLMRAIMEDAAEEDKPVTIHVERENPALSFYRRLGFRKIAEEGVYYLMEWRPRK